MKELKAILWHKAIRIWRDMCHNVAHINKFLKYTLPTKNKYQNQYKSIFTTICRVIGLCKFRPILPHHYVLSCSPFWIMLTRLLKDYKRIEWLEVMPNEFCGLKLGLYIGLVAGYNQYNFDIWLKWVTFDYENWRI